MKKIFKNTDKDIIRQARDILIKNALASDDALKREKHTCYTVQKIAWEGKYFKQAKEAFLNLGYEPRVQSENKEYITYMLPDYFL